MAVWRYQETGGITGMQDGGQEGRDPGAGDADTGILMIVNPHRQKNIPRNIA